MSEEKIICIDYDGSFTEFPDLFNIIINYCNKNGILCIMATMRNENEKDDILRELESKIQIHYTNRQAKLYYLDKLNIKPDLWIDDNPRWLFNNTI